MYYIIVKYRILCIPSKYKASGCKIIAKELKKV